MTKRTPNYIKPSWFPFSIVRFHFRILPDFKAKATYLLPIVISSFILLLTILKFSFSLSFDKLTLILSSLSMISISYTFFSFYNTYMRNKRLEIFRANEIYKLNANVEPSLKEKAAGYKKINLSYRRDSYIMSKEVNRFLRNSDKPIGLNLIKDEKKNLYKLLSKKYDLNKDVLVFRHFKSRKKGSMFFDDRKISLKTTLSSEIQNVDVYESSYYISFLTNDLATLNIDDYTDKENPEPIWRALDKFPFVQGNTKYTGKIHSLEESRMSNHIGGNTIGFTEYGTMVLWRQAPTALRSVGLLAPTGSGSLDFMDYEDLIDKTLIDLVIEGMEREFKEESQKKGSIIQNFVEKTKIIGYYRWVGKAGLPGFFGVTKLKSAKFLSPNTNEVNTRKEFPAENITELKKSIIRLETNYEERLSVPLAANIHALKQVINEDPNYLDFIFP